MFRVLKYRTADSPPDMFHLKIPSLRLAGVNLLTLLHCCCLILNSHSRHKLYITRKIVILSDFRYRIVGRRRQRPRRSTEQVELAEYDKAVDLNITQVPIVEFTHT